MRDELQDRKDLLRDEFNDKKDLINEEYKALKEAERAKTEQYNERMKQYEAEHLAKPLGVNSTQDLTPTLAVTNPRLISINGLTEAENKAIKERADAQKIEPARQIKPFLYVGG